MFNAEINPVRCVNCGICAKVCPFDAITVDGAQKHVVVAERCIGCKLCFSDCPIDCITLVPLPSELISRQNEIMLRAKQTRAIKLSSKSSENKISLSTKEEIIHDLNAWLGLNL